MLESTPSLTSEEVKEGPVSFGIVDGTVCTDRWWWMIVQGAVGGGSLFSSTVDVILGRDRAPGGGGGAAAIAAGTPFRSEEYRK